MTFKLSGLAFARNPGVRAPLLGGLAMLAACAPGRGLAPLPPTSDAAYRLGPGDRVRVITFGEQQLTGEFRVSDNGTIAVPLIGTAKASGLTSRQLAEGIGAELQRRNLFKDPSVVVEVVEYRPIFVLGEVSKPGEFPYQPNMTVLTAVAVAGGFTYRAVEDRAAVVRTVRGKPITGLATGCDRASAGRRAEDLRTELLASRA